MQIPICWSLRGANKWHSTFLPGLWVIWENKRVADGAKILPLLLIKPRLEDGAYFESQMICWLNLGIRQTPSPCCRLPSCNRNEPCLNSVVTKVVPLEERCFLRLICSPKEEACVGPHAQFTFYQNWSISHPSWK